MRPLLSALLLFALNVHATEAPEQTIGAAEALLRYIAQQPPLINATSSVCIKTDGQEAPLDLKARLKNTNLRIVPCGSDGFATQIPISDPKLESDGNYRLFSDISRTQGRWLSARQCGPSCGWTNAAGMCFVSKVASCSSVYPSHSKPLTLGGLYANQNGAGDFSC
jgi:hypothetical protein